MTAPLLFSILFLIPTIFLLQGKWSWIIAGYNTASEAEKRRYDEKKLCRTVGFLLLTMTVGFAISGIVGFFVESGHLNASVLEDVKGVFLAFVLIHGGFTLWYARHKCKK